MNKELLRRKLSSDLLEFTKYFFPHTKGTNFIVNDHHRQICDALAKVERGEIKNLLINMPPRYGKTELAVVNWVAQCIARNPRAKFIHLSYAESLVLENSGHCKELIQSEAYQELWPVKLKQDSKSKQKWYTLGGGGLYATPAGGPITGFGAGITEDDDAELFGGAIIIDDPLKPDDALSEAQRTHINERLNSTIKSRRNSRQTPIVIIMQRLHEDDMSGYVLADGMGEPFEHLVLKALQDDGQPLWVLKHSVDDLLNLKLKDRFNFASQYQQEPAPMEGAIFKKDWFVRYDNLPPKETVTQIIHSWDTAYKPKQHNDPSVCTVWHVTPTLYYLADVVRGRWEYPELKRRVFDMGQSANAILIEDKASGQSLIQEFHSRTSLPVIAIEPEGDKETRARVQAAQVEAGRIALPRYASWLSDYENEMLLFPFSANDDQVDSTSQFLRWIQERSPDESRRFEEMLEDW